MGGSENPSLSMETKHKGSVLTSVGYQRHCLLRKAALLGLKTFSPMWSGARCDRAAAGGSVDRKEIPEPSLLSSGKRPEDSSEPFALWASVSSGLVPEMSLQLPIPDINSPGIDNEARLPRGTRDPGQNRQPTLLVQDCMWLRHSHRSQQ